MDRCTFPRVRWFQVSLKTLLILMLVVAAFFAGWGIAERRAEKAILKARQAAEAAEKARADVEGRGDLDVELLGGVRIWWAKQAGKQ